MLVYYKAFNKFWSIHCKFYFDKSDTNKILFDQNCHWQIPGVDVYCFGVSNDICMLCASMNVYQVFKGRPISGLLCYANPCIIIYSNSRLQIYWWMHVIAFTFYALIINKNWFENYNWLVIFLWSLYKYFHPFFFSMFVLIKYIIYILL